MPTSAVRERPESWFPPRVEPARLALGAALATAGFLLAWAVLHEGFYARYVIVDTPIYQDYGERMAAGELPYRDFRVEYPPGALPAFVLPALTLDRSSAPERYVRRFEWLMAACGTAALILMAMSLLSLRADGRRAAAALGFAALAPLALGSVILSRFDLWPAALAAGALAAFLHGRDRLGSGVLGLAVVAKLYPAVLVPLAAAWIWRRRGRGEALVCGGILAAVVALAFVPFLVLAPGGVAESLGHQLSRPLQVESLGAAGLFALRNLFGLGLELRSGHGSQNLAGALPTAVGLAQSLVQIGVLVWIWRAFACGPPERERLVRYSAAAVLAFVALGKVLSPQFLIWLLPFVPLVGGRRGLAASALLGLALVLTQLWFPFRYWDFALRFDETSAWLVLARDVVLAACLAVLVWPVSRGSPPKGVTTSN